MTPSPFTIACGIIILFAVSVLLVALFFRGKQRDDDDEPPEDLEPLDPFDAERDAEPGARDKYECAYYTLGGPDGKTPIKAPNKRPR